MSTKSARSRAHIKDPLPTPRGVEVVPIGQVAGLLGWSVSKLRSVGLFLKPFILADGTRLYDVDRALAWARIEDEFIARSDVREAQEQRAIRKVRRWARGVRRWLRGKDVPHDRRLMAIGRIAVSAESYTQTLRSGFDTVVAHAGLLCMLELIGTAAVGLSAQGRSLYPQIPWDRVEALAALHKTWNGRLFRNGMDVIVPLLRRAGMRTGIRRIDDPQRSAGATSCDAKKRRMVADKEALPMQHSVRADDQRRKLASAIHALRPRLDRRRASPRRDSRRAKT
jgi:hypothetical protein